MEEKFFGIIYRAYIEDGRCYVGQTIQSLKRRMYEHKSKSKYNKNHFQNAINKYGFDKFKWEILEYCSSLEELNISEKKWIKIFNSIENGFNIAEGGGNGPMKESTKEILSKQRVGQNNPNYGKNSFMRGKNNLNTDLIPTKFKKGNIPWNKGLKENNRRKRLTNEEKEEIYKMYDNKILRREIAQKFSITENSVTRIVKKRLKNND